MDEIIGYKCTVELHRMYPTSNFDFVVHTDYPIGKTTIHTRVTYGADKHTLNVCIF